MLKKFVMKLKYLAKLMTLKCFSRSMMIVKIGCPRQSGGIESKLIASLLLWLTFYSDALNRKPFLSKRGARMDCNLSRIFLNLGVRS